MCFVQSPSKLLQEDWGQRLVQGFLCKDVSLCGELVQTGCTLAAAAAGEAPFQGEFRLQMVCLSSCEKQKLTLYYRWTNYQTCKFGI